LNQAIDFTKIFMKDLPLE